MDSSLAKDAQAQRDEIASDMEVSSTASQQLKVEGTFSRWK
jgi:hypothetical protein